MQRHCLDCQRLIDKGSRCRACHAALKRPYRTLAWQTAREQAKARDGYRCRQCGSDYLLDVHHRNPLRAGGTHSLENLTTLCRSCHAEAEREVRS